MYQENAVVKAIEHLTQLIEASPWSVDFLEARAECHEHRGMYDDAILDLRYFWNQNLCITGFLNYCIIILFSGPQQS